MFFSMKIAIDQLHKPAGPWLRLPSLFLAGCANASAELPEPCAHPDASIHSRWAAFPRILIPFVSMCKFGKIFSSCCPWLQNLRCASKKSILHGFRCCLHLFAVFIVIWKCIHHLGCSLQKSWFGVKIGFLPNKSTSRKLNEPHTAGMAFLSSLLDGTL